MKMAINAKIRKCRVCLAPKLRLASQLGEGEKMEEQLVL